MFPLSCITRDFDDKLAKSHSMIHRHISMNTIHWECNLYYIRIEQIHYA